MDSNLREEYIRTLFRFKKTGFHFPKALEVNMTELFVMMGMNRNTFCHGKNVNVPEIQNHMHITKAAISQIFTSLEKRGYIIRETDRTNRRKITVELTDAGRKVLEDAKEQMDQELDLILSRFGEQNAWQLIALLRQMSDISDEIKKEREQSSAAEKRKSDKTENIEGESSI